MRPSSDCSMAPMEFPFDLTNGHALLWRHGGKSCDYAPTKWRQPKRQRSLTMNRIVIAIATVAIVAIVALTGCGVETMGTAATGAVLKKQELEQGRKNMQTAQQKIDQAVQQMNQSAQR